MRKIDSVVSGDSRRRRRSGVALIGALVTLGIVSALLASIGGLIAANRRQIEHRQQEIQVGWLARGGIELAAAGLLDAPDSYKGQSWKPIPRSEVRIAVEREKGSKDAFRVVSEARYPTTMRTAAARWITRRLRRVVDGDRVRIEVSAAEEPAKR